MADLPGLLKQAAAFALPRASGLFSTAGFPTKLGEFLASAKPVVVTATGDIPLYLHDGVDAYVVPPDDARAFAARLAEMFADPAAAQAVGARGRETARQHFEVESQCRRLAVFMAEFGAIATTALAATVCRQLRDAPSQAGSFTGVQGRSTLLGNGCAPLALLRRPFPPGVASSDESTSP